MKNKRVKKVIGLITSFVVLYIFILIYPGFLFANKYQYSNFHIFSDQPIPEQIEDVIDDAIRRIEGSSLYESTDEFYLYLCNEDWRFKFFTRNGNAGGVVNFVISKNIFIRENEIATNRLIPPRKWKNPLTDRPLSYFIAHEAIHSLQRKYDRFLVLKVPVEIVEGYAEYIAKSPTRDMELLKEDWWGSAPTMDPSNGLYDKYHLYVGYLMEEKGYDFERLLEERPNIDSTLNRIDR